MERPGEEDAMGGFVRVEVDDRVATIRIDRPPANALDETVSGELRAAAEACAERDDVGAIVVWGGERLFAAGADIKRMARMPPEQARPWVAALGDALDVLEAVPKVSIAAVNGFALGGGCELALACDLRYAAEDARLGQPEVRLGLIPGAGGTQRLPRLVGLGRAKDLVLTGRQVDAGEARAIGLVDRVLPAAEVYATAVADARGFARGPREALAAAKRLLDLAGRVDVVEGLAAERDAFVTLFGTEDRIEGTRAFVEKREPRFGGR
jgi:enoyl-CoA hydratase/carnithine racemase